MIILQAGSVFSQDRLPVREYTNPDEMVAFDRNTSFQRALDVINEFSQENVGKIVLDQTGTDEALGISIPPMHWRDALDLMLRVKGLYMVEQPEFFEITMPPSPDGRQLQATAAGGPAAANEELLATTESREVRINAIFFEGNRRALQEIGVDWSTLSVNSPENLSDFVGTEGNETLPATGFNDQFVSVNSIGAQNVSQNVFNSLVNFGEIGTSGIEVQALFSAFEADNLGEILASPSVKVMDGQEGHIQVGQDFSIKQRDFAGNVTDQFFSTGTILTVTPSVITYQDTTFIHLNVAAERSTAQPDPVSTIVNKQEAETQSLLMDGEATAIAGLYTSEASEVRRGIPVLKDLPPWFFGLRYLFGYNSKDYAMRELVILVQAELEPSIPERFGRSLESKYEILNEERQRIRTELDRKEQFSPTQSLDDDVLEGERSEMESESPVEDDIFETEEEEAAIDEEPRTQQEESDETDRTGDEDQKEEEEQVMDPEVDNEPVPLNLGGEEEEEMEGEEPDQEAGDDEGEEPSAEETAPPDVQEAEDPNRSNDTGDIEQFNYFIIGASFASENNAVQFKERLSDEGFNAIILTSPGATYHYVAYEGFRTLQEAKDGLENIKQRYSTDAWLYARE